MNTKLLALLNVIVNAIDVYVTAVTKIDVIRAIVKFTKRLITFTLFLGVLLLSTWLSILGMCFVYLVSFGLNHVEALAIILGVNLFGLVVLLIWFCCIKKQITSLRRSSVKVILTYIVKSISRLCGKK